MYTSMNMFIAPMITHDERFINFLRVLKIQNSHKTQQLNFLKNHHFESHPNFIERNIKPTMSNHQSTSPQGQVYPASLPPPRTLDFELSSQAMRSNPGNLLVLNFVWKVVNLAKGRGLMLSAGTMAAEIFDTIQETRPSIVFVLPSSRANPPGEEQQRYPLNKGKSIEIIRRILEPYIAGRDGFEEFRWSLAWIENIGDLSHSERNLHLLYSAWITKLQDVSDPLLYFPNQSPLPRLISRSSF